ncbi:MAG: hypothetical protein SFU85_05625 [Candidatus Methylacidiphilales bacterium]|nr:hypothetical protein [Candidatus Methylacidiphilales bacterium]
MKTAMVTGWVLMVMAAGLTASPVVQATHGVYQTNYKAGLNEIVVSRTPADHIPVRAGTQHSWIIQVVPASYPRSIREVYTLPAPGRWGNVEGEQVSADRKQCVVEGTIQPGQTYAFNTWGMDADDPVGNYRISIYIDDVLVKTFSFEAVR